MGKVVSLFFPEKIYFIEKKIIKLWNVIDMLSIYETYCDLHDLTLDKRMFLSDGSASPVKRDPQTDAR